MGQPSFFDNVREWIAGGAFKCFLWAIRISQDEYLSAIGQQEIERLGRPSADVFIDAIQGEIVWCLDNPDEDLTKDQQMGFMNGLRQAQLLIEKINEASKIHLGKYEA
jgi:hypothetical protein